MQSLAGLGSENRSPQSQGVTRKHSPTCHTRSGDQNNSQHRPVRKHDQRAAHLVRGHRHSLCHHPHSAPQPRTPSVLTRPPGPQPHTVTYSHVRCPPPHCLILLSQTQNSQAFSPGCSSPAPLSPTLPAHSPPPSAHQLPLPLQLQAAHRTSLLTPPSVTPGHWGKGTAWQRSCCVRRGQ